MAARFENIEKANKVTVDISFGILDRVTHARLSGQVNHYVEIVLCKQPLNKRRITQITAHEGKAVIDICLGQHAKARLFDARIVVAVHIVQADNNIVGVLQQFFHQK